MFHRIRHHGCHGRHEGMWAMAMGRGGRGGWGDWGAEWGGGRGGRHGRGRRRVLDSSELRLVLLKLIADQPRHGYDLMKAVEELTAGAYTPSPGVVYPTLTMLQDMGFITEAAGDGNRKAFAVTPEGDANLRENEEEVTGLFERLSALGEPERNADRASIRRAVGNLMTALWQRVSEHGIDDETVHEIAAILDDAAQKIERLK